MNLEYTTVVNPRAKRLSFTVSPIDGLRVVMPKKLSDAYVQRILRRHRPWIEEQLNAIEYDQKRFARYQFQDGGTTLWNGEPRSIEIISGPRRVIMQGGVIQLSNRDSAISEIKRMYAQWVKRKARKQFTSILDEYSQLSGIAYQRLSIRGQSSRWGSCSNKGSISMNWKLLCAPTYVQGYVAIHELVHISELNHSKEFWKLVDTYSSSRKASQAWLQRNGDLIQFVSRQFS